MPQTVTSYFVFEPLKKRRSNEVNLNFNALRGSRLPLEASTVGATDSENDIGQSGHIWNVSYLRKMDFAHLTTTTRFLWSANTAGNIDLFLGDGVSSPDSADTLTGEIIDGKGYRGFVPTEPAYNTNSSADFAQAPQYFLANSGISSNTGTPNTMATMRLDVKHGSVIECVFKAEEGHRWGAANASDYRNTSGVTNSSANMEIYFGATTTALTLGAKIAWGTSDILRSGQMLWHFYLTSVGSGELVFESRFVSNGAYQTILENTLFMVHEIF